MSLSTSSLLSKTLNFIRLSLSYNPFHRQVIYMVNKILFFFFFLFLFFSCGHVSMHSTYRTAASTTDDVVESEMLPSPLNLNAGQYAEELKVAVDKWVKYFCENDRERFQRFLDRGEAYRHVVQTVLKENDIPPEFYYLAMIESGYVTHARSHAKAVGVWQFISSTGKKYGLEIDHYIDERKDPIRATEAAAKYLRDLYTAFQSWELAMAAYNAGEYRILTSIINGKTRNFWELADRKLLPRETRNYVPKFIAAATIGANPEQYGFRAGGDSEVEQFPSVFALEVPSPVRLKSIAKLSGISLEELQKINPHLKKGITSPRSETYELWIPSEKKDEMQSLLPQLAQMRLKGIKGRAYASNPEPRYYHRVRRGENLSTIARKYRVSIAHLKRLNNLASSRIYVNQKLRLQATSYSRGNNDSADRTYHIVRRGENLSTIARKYRLSVAQLKRLNNLSGNRIYVRQRLSVQDTDRAIASSKRFHVVRRGENLIYIARKYRLSVAEIKRLNNLSGSRIYINQKLKISEEENSSDNLTSKMYRVRKGDSLYSIARKKGTSVKRLMNKNQLASARIYPGMNLNI